MIEWLITRDFYLFKNSVFTKNSNLLNVKNNLEKLFIAIDNSYQYIPLIFYFLQGTILS